MATIATVSQNGELTKFFWRDELVQELIDMYRDRTCLYDSKSKDYHNREAKKRCYEEMADQIGASVEEVMKKLKCIRSQYSREKQKARLRKARYGADEVYTSRWMYYDRLSFLDNFLVVKGSTVAMNGEIPVEDDMESECFMVDGANNSANYLPVELPNVSPITDHTHPALHHHTFQPSPIQHTYQQSPQQTMSPPQSSTSRKRRRSESSEEDILRRVLVCVEKAAKDKVKRGATNSIFGQYVASELDDIESVELQRWAKQQITSILYQAQSGQILSPSR